MRVLIVDDSAPFRRAARAVLLVSSDGAADAALAEAHGARGYVPKEDLGSVDLSTFWA